MVKGYIQQFGVDFDQTFTAVIKPILFQVLFVIATYFDLNIDQIDVKTAFLYEFINQLIFVEILKKTKIDANKNMVYKLFKAPYDLKQLPCLRYKKLSTFSSENFIWQDPINLP